MEFSLEEIKDMLSAFEERDIHLFHLKQGEFELVLERPAPAGVISAAQPVQQMLPAQPAVAQLPAHFPSPASQAAEAPAALEDANATYIDSPMVGTFYSASAPGESSFVNVGDTVKEGDVVCIVEAMKVMNEVKATSSGIIQEVLVEDGQPVEFGTKIFKIG